MYRLYPYLKWIWGAFFLALAINLLSDCLSGLLLELEGGTCDLNQAVLDFLLTYGDLVMLVLLVLIVLSLLVRQSHVYQEAYQRFALLKRAEEIRPEDLEFQVLESGERAGPRRRPFYPIYICRSASRVGKPDDTFDEEGLVEQLKSSSGFVLLGPPLSGKSRTLYEIVKRMKGYKILSPLKGKEVPEDEAFLLLLRGRQVILLLEDLNDFIASETPLHELALKLDRYASEWVVASTCGDGPEMAVIKAAEGTALGRFYREMIPLKLELRPLTSEQKQELAHGIGVEEWELQQSEWHPTPGSITMEEPMRAMRQRFAHALRPEQQDALRALQLLAFGGVHPFTHPRLQSVLDHERLFERSGLHLRDCLEVLSEQAFIRRPAPQDPVQVEPAYLRDAVAYTEGKSPIDDFPELASVLQKIGDHRGLFYLGLTYLTLQNVERSLACYDQSISLRPDNAAAWNNKAATLETLGYHKEALEAAERALQLKPDYPESWSNKGNSLGSVGRPEEALDAFDRALILRPNLPEAWLNKGGTLKDLGRYSEALEAYDRALCLRPDFPEALSNKGVALEGLGFLEEALESYDQALRLMPLNAVAWNNKAGVLAKLGRFQDALEAATRALGLKPNYAGAWSNKGGILKGLERYQEALAAFDEALSLKPHLPEAWNNKSLALGACGQQEEALEAVGRALDLRPDYPDAFYTKGGILGELNRAQEALESTEKALELRPNYPEALHNKGLLLRRLGHYQESLEVFEQTIRLKSDFAAAFQGKAITLMYMGRYENALETFNQVIELKPNDSEAWYNKGTALLELKRYEEALQTVEEALRFGGYNPEVWNLKSLILSRLERYDEALEASDKALALKDSSFGYWDTKSWILIKLEHYEQALEASEEALKLKADDHPEAWENKGLALKELGRHDEAVLWLCKAWLSRERLPDGGTLIANTLRALGHAPEACE